MLLTFCQYSFAANRREFVFTKSVDFLNDGASRSKCDLHSLNRGYALPDNLGGVTKGLSRLQVSNNILMLVNKLVAAQVAHLPSSKNYASIPRQDESGLS